ncbi:unnamed protein product [Choristocarpus tenellus]
MRDLIRPVSKSDFRHIGILLHIFRATSHHMEPGWASIDLLDLMNDALNPNLGEERSSVVLLNSIRILPQLVAGDLFIINAARGSIDVTLAYYNRGLPINHHHTKLKYQALHLAAEFGHLDTVRLLVAMGAMVDCRGGPDERSPLFLAALAKRWSVCCWLLGAGASKTLTDRNGSTPYEVVVESTDPEVLDHAGILTDLPQKVVSLTCTGLCQDWLQIMWSEPLKSYKGENFTGYKVG